MPLPKRPYVASADQVRITRDGDDAIIEYADDSVATTHLKVGAEKLAAMTDEELLAFWNDGIEAGEDHRQSLSYTARRASNSRRFASTHVRMTLRELT